MSSQFNHQIVLYDDENQSNIEQITLEPQTAKQPQQIIVFDDDKDEEDDHQYQEEIQFSRNGILFMKENQEKMTNKEYEDKCSELTEKIMFSNLSNFRNDLKKPQKNFFKEAKVAKRNTEILQHNRKSITKQLNFEPLIKDVKCQIICPSNNFHLQTYNDVGLDDCLNDVLTGQSFCDDIKYQMKGAHIVTKNSLVVEELREKNLLKVSNFREFLYTQLKQNYQIFIFIKRTEDGIFNSKFKFYFQENSKFIMSCERQMFGKYVFSSSQIHNKEDHISYLGKMESNFLGSQFIIYDSGQDFSKTKMMENYKKQLGFVEYSQQKGQPRKFKTMITTCDNKRTDFTIKDSAQNNIIQQKWMQNRRRNIQLLTSKQPNYDPEDCNYKLNFRGLAGVASIKNFIVENENNQQALIFGRHDKDTYLMRIKAPFSLIQAAAICMSSIHYKFL